jgi:hypothetical protein
MKTPTKPPGKDAVRDLLAAAKAIIFACEIASIGCGDEFDVLHHAIEVAEGRP